MYREYYSIYLPYKTAINERTLLYTKPYSW